MSNKNLEECVSVRKKLYNDLEFREVVKTFHEIVTQINKNFKKQKRKKQAQQPIQQIQPKKKEEAKEFKRNSYHIQIAYKLYTINLQQNQFEDIDPTYHSKKMRSNNLMEIENQQQSNGINNPTSKETIVQR